MRFPVALTLAATLLTGLGLFAISAGAASAAGDPQKGATLATTCMGCHGIPGYRNAYPSYRVPKLGGQNADYIVVALQGYRAKTRPHPTMQAQAASLSDQDMQDLAAYFAGQGEAKQAATVATDGKDKAATCAACHGEAGISSAPNWPNLAGQHRDYLVQSINTYRAKLRQDPTMQGMAAALTDADVEALATYFSSQSGLFSTEMKN